MAWKLASSMLIVQSYKNEENILFVDALNTFYSLL